MCVRVSEFMCVCHKHSLTHSLTLSHTHAQTQITLEFDGWWGKYQPCNPVGNGEPWPQLNLSDFQCSPRAIRDNNGTNCRHIVNAVGGEPYSDGYWYNTPSQGQCAPGNSPGDPSGCTWRLREVL